MSAKPMLLCWAMVLLLLKRYPLPWRTLRPGEEVREDRKDHTKRVFRAEDFCIVDKDGYEVIGASHYLRCDHGATLRFICETVNRAGEGGKVLQEGTEITERGGALATEGQRVNAG